MKSSKLLMVAGLGSALEYYDFVIYALAAPYLSQVFFPHADPSVSYLQTVGVFAMGYMARPLGGIILGHMGDCYGRGFSFRLSMGLMAVATLLIGCLPGYEAWGILSPSLLILLRLLQGLALGAELPGAMTLLCEHGQSEKRGARCSWLFSAASLGSLLAMLVFFGLSQCHHEAFWRVPFYLGGILAGLVYWLRKQNLETMDFKPAVGFPLAKIVKNHPQALLTGVSLCLFQACLVIFYLYLPAYLKLTHEFSAKAVYAATTLGMVWVMLCLPLLGKFSDYYGHYRVLCLATIIMTAVIPLGLCYASQPWQLMGFTMLYQTGVGLLTACYPALLTALFPRENRYTGVALCYNLAYLLAGCLPGFLAVFSGHINWVLPIIALTSIGLSRKMSTS